MEFSNIDIVAIAGSGQRAISLSSTLTVEDGAVSISVGKIENEPKISGIEIRRSLPHLAHAVSNGPYFGVDTDNDGLALVALDGSESHTHATDLQLVDWIWREGNRIIARGEKASITLSIGVHEIDLTVTDNGGNEATDSTTVNVHPFGFPSLSSVSPAYGKLHGGENVTISGTGFNYDASEIVVHFGVERFTGDSIRVVNSTTIVVTSPKVPITAPVEVSVATPLGRSKDAVTFTYLSSTPIKFSSKLLLEFSQPSSAAFGPDGKLYVGSIKGMLAKITMDADYSYVTSIVTAVVQPDRAILGIAFDPMDAGNPIPPIYISSSGLFHGGRLSSSWTSINGKINRVIGANLDLVEDIITGLPVCDNDHGTFTKLYRAKMKIVVHIQCKRILTT
jgi:IPT/TIG domain